MHGFQSQTVGRSTATTPRTGKPALRLRLAWLLGVVIAAAWTFAGCTGQISEPGSAPDNLNGNGSVGPNGKPSGNSTTKSGGTTPGNSQGGSTTNGAPGSGSTSGSSAPSCTGKSAAPAPLARLTNLEYTNSLTALFPNLTLPALSLPADNIVEGFDNNAKAQTPSPALIEQYRVSAQAVAASVTAKLSTALPCNPTTSAQQDACGQQWIDSFVPRAYRRPITSDERTRLDGLFSSAKTTYDFPTAVSMVVQAVLQSPNFLYRVEIGGAVSGGVAPLTGYEMAARLSYFFWDTMPDDTLTAAADSGALDNASGVEDQARRLLDDPRAKNAVANLFHQWLRFDKMDAMVKDSTAFPSWNANVAASLRTSAGKFVDHVFWDLGGALDSLLTDTSTYVDANIAPIYGLPASAAANSALSMNLASTDKTQRSGVLTQAGLMAAFAHETADSPVLRGVFVMDRLLCAAPPPPPAGVTGSITATNATGQAMTTRQEVATTHEQGTCASCHHAIDGFGFGFEHYDAIGKWRDTDNGLPVDASGWIAGTTDADGTFNGVVDLGQRLAKSTQVSDCVASQWFRYSLGLGAADVNSCDIAPVKQAFATNHGDMQELMVATVTSDAFRSRPQVMQ